LIAEDESGVHGNVDAVEDEVMDEELNCVQNTVNSLRKTEMFVASMIGIG